MNEKKSSVSKTVTVTAVERPTRKLILLRSVQVRITDLYAEVPHE